MAGKALTMVTATTAPARRKQNKYSVTFCGVNETNQLTIGIRVQDEADGLVSERDLYANPTERTGLVYGADAEIAEVKGASTPAAVLADFNAFFATAGTFAARAAALEARLVATGRLPA